MADAGVTPGVTIKYSCDLGFELERPVGGDSLVCTSLGQWWPGDRSRTRPRCSRVDCGRPPLVDNGMVEVGDTRWNSSVFYTCDPGYRLVGNARLSCSSRGIWSARLDGDDDSDVVDLYAQPSLVEEDPYRFGSMRPPEEPFSRGMNIYGMANQFYDLPPACRRVRCLGRPPSGSDARVRAHVAGRNPGDFVRYSCPSGLSLRGAREVICKEDGRWDRIAKRQRYSTVQYTMRKWIGSVGKLAFCHYLFFY